MAHWDFAKGVKGREILDLPVLSPALLKRKTPFGKLFIPPEAKLRPPRNSDRFNLLFGLTQNLGDQTTFSNVPAQAT